MNNVTLAFAKTRLSVRQRLFEQSEFDAVITARLNETLKANLVAHLVGEPEPRLAKMIAEMEPPNFATTEDMTLREFATYALRDRVGEDEELREEYEQLLSNLPDNRKLNDILQLDQKLEQHPLFTDMVKDARLNSVLALTPLREQTDRIEQFKTVLDRCGGVHVGFWKVLAEEEIASQEEIEDIKLSFDLTALALDNVELAKVLKTRDIHSIRDLIPLHREDWLDLLRENQIAPPESFTGEQPLEAYATHLESAVADASPTEMFFNRLFTQEVEAYRADLACVEPFLRANPGIALEQEIAFRKVRWHSEERRERNRVKKSIENLRMGLKLYGQLGLAAIVNDPQQAPDDKVQAIKGELAKLGTFLQNNPRLDLHHADFHRDYATAMSHEGEEDPRISWDGFEATDRAIVKQQLMVYQRLFRIHPRFKTAQVLLENDLDSAHKIILLTEEQFVERYAERLSNPSPNIPQALYSKALGIAENTIHQWANVKDVIASPAWKNLLSNNTTKTAQQYYQSFQSYQDMFGSLNFCECKDCQSIFGPAAYFVDLMRFIDLNITQATVNQIPPDYTLKKRRPDLWRLPLDCENAETLISHLDIVNEILEAQLGATKANLEIPYEKLRDAVHPFNLPVNVPLAEIRIYLSHFRKTLSEIYEAFGVAESPVACEYLGLSKEKQAVLTTYALGQNDLAKVYGIGNQQLYSTAAGGLARVKTFLQHTGLTRKELDELLFQNLSHAERASDVQARFFINKVDDGLGSLAVALDTETDQSGNKVPFEKIINFSERKLNYIHRFGRLAEELGWSFAALDWVLGSVGGGASPANIDQVTLTRLAKIKQWQNTFSLPLDILCSFWFRVKHIGQGDTPDSAPLDLFNRLFNHPDILKGRASYDLTQPTTWQLNSAADENRNRLLAALEITNEELNLIVEQVAGANVSTLSLTHENLSRLYRFGRIPKALSLSVQEFVWLLGLMHKDGLIATAEIDSLDDFGKLVNIVDWLKTAELSVYELHYLLTGTINPYVETGYTDTAIRLLTEDLSREFKNALVRSTTFTGIDGVTQSQATAIYTHLVATGFLIQDKSGARLTDTFTSETQGFTLGLPPTLAPFEQQIIEILKAHDEKKIALKRLAVFFNVEPDLLKSMIAFAGYRLEDTALLTLLSTPIKEDETVPSPITDFLRPVHVRLFLGSKLGFSQSEIDSIVANPEYYGINDVEVLKIANIETLHSFKQLTENFSDTTDALTGYFKPGSRQDKIKRLAVLTRWDEAEVKLLVDRFWPGQNTDYSHVAAVRKLKKCFDISRYMGVGIKPLLAWVKTADGIWADYNAAAQSALEILKAKYSEAEWKQKYEPLADKIRTLKRDALAAYAIWNIDTSWPAGVPQIDNLRDLYAYLLIDVEMTSCAKTSRIAQGIAALQLYIQRCQMNLEPGVQPESVPTKQWEWMKNYRVWEANRKVFLYPENYIEPELRDDKSPIFKELEDELLQSEVTAEAVEKAYRNYLNKFAELANLRIAGSYHDTGTDTLYLFGRTNTQPYTYYYRTYKKQTTWTPWQKVNLSIKSEYVSPIFAFNRLFVFWVELSKTKESKIEGGDSKEPVEKRKATVKYSFYDFNKNWVQSQTFDEIDDQLIVPTEERSPYRDYVYPVRLKEVQSNFEDELYIKYGGRSGSDYQLIGFASKTLRKNLGSSDFKTSLLSIPIHRVVHTYEDFFSPTRRLVIAWEKRTGNEIDVYNYYSEASWYGDIKHTKNVIYLLKEGIFEGPPIVAVKSVNSSKQIDKFIFDNDDEKFLIHFYWTAWFTPAFAFTRISTHPVHTLSEQLFSGGLGELLSTRTQQSNFELNFQRFSPDPVIVPPSNKSHLDFDGAYGHYYWEVFFHTPFVVADRLNADQKFSDAQKWYHYLYNPTIQQPELGETFKEPKDVVWRFLPFRDLTLETLQDMLTNPAALEEYHQNPFKPHAIARLRWSAYQKAIVMKYIDNLLDWGDYLFAQDTREAINEATQLYVLAYNLLGPRPEKLGACKPDQPATFEDMEKKYQQGSLIPEFLIELENSTIAATAASGTPGLNNAFSFYFCVPENEEFLKYWDRVESSLDKIRHCMNIKGVVRELALFSPPISPMALVQAAAAGRDISSVLTEVLRPVPPYRFTFMLEKAKNLCATVQQLGSALLSALEKKDAEELALLRSTHEKNILQLTTMVREKQREEANESHAALLESKASATARNQHYKNLIKKGLSHYESTHLASMLIAWGLEQEANILSTMASIGYAVPQAGSPFAMTYGGRELGAVLTAVAHAFRAFASFYTLSGSMSSTLGSYERRRQDWTLQEQLAQHDLDQIEKQIAAAKLREQIAKQEIDIHAKNIEQADKVYDFMKDKFSSKDLHQWMANQLSGLYFQTYKLAYDLAKSAEKAYQYERDTEETYINFGHWDSLKKGLLAGERLMLELNQLEKAYLDDNTRPFEIEKTISLAHVDPLALIDLKKKGDCTFDLTEELFDYDFPGHYCRKIKTIALSIPAIAGPYENIKATLTQKGHKTLLQPDTTALMANSVKLDADADSVRSDWIKNQQIAISRGVNDSGMFELNFRDERYLPFEGTGAVSHWELEMPKATNRIDFDSISDVIIHLKYTARYDGTLRKKIEELLKKVSGYRILSLKHEFSTAWHRFMNPETGKTEHELKFNLSEKLFPPNAKNYEIESLHCKVDLAPGILPIGADLTLSVQPAKATGFTLKFDQSDRTDKTLAGGSQFGDWVIKVTRDTIPAKLRRKKAGVDEFELIAGKNYYYLDPGKVKNIGMLLLYESTLIWSSDGNGEQ